MKSVRVIIVVISLFFSCVDSTFLYAEKFPQQLVSETKTSPDIPTGYVWADNDGREYPIYISFTQSGADSVKWEAFIYKASKTGGKKCKCYLKDGDKIAEDIIDNMSKEFSDMAPSKR